MSDSEEECAEKQLKFILVGTSGVGKTCIATRYAQDTFNRHTQPTAGVDFFLKRAVLPGRRSLTLQIWDVGSQALEGKMLDKYVFGAHAVIFVYDITNSSSFETLDDWIEAIKQIIASQEKYPLMALIANKSDLEHLRAVRVDRHVKLAQEHGLSTFLISAKSGESLALAFQKISAEILGIRLSRVEQEQHQPVVRAEITSENLLPRVPVNQSMRTAVCSIQ